MEKKGLSLNLQKKPTKVIAHKRTMNFAYHKSVVDWKRLGIVLGIVLLVVILFLKFGIIDQIARKTDAQNLLSDCQNQLAIINTKMAKYNDLKAEYDRYTDARLNENETFLISRVDVLEIIEDYVMSYGTISNVRIRGNTVNMTIDGLSLEEAGQLFTEMQEHEQILDVELAYANSPDGDIATMSIVLEMQKGAVENEDA